MSDTPSSTPAAPQPLSPSDERLWGSLAHFGNILGVIPPLVIWLIFKDRSAVVNQEGKEATNWGINVIGIVIAGTILNIILGFVPILGLLFGVLFTLLVIALWVVNLVFAILGGVKVNQGGTYRYPINYRWIK